MAAASPVRFGPLQRMLERLATVAWPSVGALQQRTFCLDPDQLFDVHAEPDLERVLEALLSHARRVAPGLLVPHYAPIVQMVSLTAMATFVAHVRPVTLWHRPPESRMTRLGVSR